mmetsp:Transcript_16333/g.29873  ORF Transcript_16333/g.29873 Transcript_16333/m.29873 type:complete len:362 (+) Transcript_16333:343-1428(+)
MSDFGVVDLVRWTGIAAVTATLGSACTIGKYSTLLLPGSGYPAVEDQVNAKTVSRSLNDPALGEQFKVPLKKIKLHACVKGAQGRPLVVFLHGYMDCFYSWRRMQSHLAEQGFYTVSFDQRGTGASSAPSARLLYTPERLAEDVLDLIEAMGYKKCTLIGHDWGAATALTFAHLYPSAVERLCVINPKHVAAWLTPATGAKDLFYTNSNVWMINAGFSTNYFRANRFRVLDTVLLKKNAAAFTTEDVAVIKSHLQRNSKSFYTMNRPFQAMLLPGPTSYTRRAYKKKLPHRTLVVWGLASKSLTSYSHLSYFREKYLGPNTVEVRLDSAGQWPHLEEHERVAAAINDLMIGILPEERAPKR